MKSYQFHAAKVVEMTKVCQPYTSLFDIGRVEVDKRTLAEYREWLMKTIEFFPGIVVFHDGSAGELPSCAVPELVQLEDLYVGKWIPEIEKLLAEFVASVPNDITFRLPRYSIVQFAKFELAIHLRMKYSAKSYCWVDAGISRFLPFQSTSKNITLFEENVSRLLDTDLDYLFEVDLRRNLRFKVPHLAESRPGTSRRVMSGGSFWMRDSGVEHLWRTVTRAADEWMNQGIWDNEQVMLRSILAGSVENVGFLRQGNNSTGTVARRLLTKPLKHPVLYSSLIKRLL
jgi:hypothetical protein